MSLTDQIQGCLNEIRPQIQMEGGDIEFVELKDDGKVVVRLVGACGSCPMATMTLKQGVERYLQERIPEVNEVVQAF